MTTVKVRRNRLTLPEEARRKLQISESDELELELTDDGILLRSAASKRAEAKRRLREAQAAVKPSKEALEMSPREQEEWIAQEVKAFRRAQRAKSEHE